MKQIIKPNQNSLSELLYWITEKSWFEVPTTGLFSNKNC